jgi:hypothetical protein
MRKIVLTFILAFSIVILTIAQEYNTGVGLRAGVSSGLTIKHFINGKSALEGLLATRGKGLDITGLYEMHNQAFEVEHLNWYYGFGAHIGFYDGVKWGDVGTTYAVIGIDGILGIEYSFSEAPINIGIDLKPTMNLIGYYDFWADAAVSIRYIF